MLSVYWKQSLGQLMVKNLSPWKSLLFPGQEVSEVWREKLTKIAFLSLVESTWITGFWMKREIKVVIYQLKSRRVRRTVCMEPQRTMQTH